MTDNAGNKDEPPEGIEGFDLPEDEAETGLEAPVVEEEPAVPPPGASPRPCGG